MPMLKFRALNQRAKEAVAVELGKTCGGNHGLAPFDVRMAAQAESFLTEGLNPS